MIETEDMTKIVVTKDDLQFCDSNEVEHEIHFLFYCPKYPGLRNEFFAQVGRFPEHFQQLGTW